MTVKCSHVFAAAIAVLLPVGATLAADSTPAADSTLANATPAATAPSSSAVTPVYGYGCYDEEDPLREFALRAEPGACMPPARQPRSANIRAWIPRPLERGRDCQRRPAHAGFRGHRQR